MYLFITGISVPNFSSKWRSC